jgi:hypothetical protein
VSAAASTSASASAAKKAKKTPFASASAADSNANDDPMEIETVRAHPEDRPGLMIPHCVQVADIKDSGDSGGGGGGGGGGAGGEGSGELQDVASLLGVSVEQLTYIEKQEIDHTALNEMFDGLREARDPFLYLVNSSVATGE